MDKNTKKIFIGTGIGAAGAVVIGAACHFTTNYLMRVALDREGPKSMQKRKKKMNSSSKTSEITAKIAAAAKELEGSGLEQVKIESHDGICLAGHWYCPSTPKRVVIAMHGWRSTWAKDFGIISPFLHRNDCAVLYAEQRGQGNSGGEYMGFGLLERYDCLDWINWAIARTKGELPVYLAGISMGATTVLMTAGFTLPSNVRGIIADCGFTSPNEIWKYVAKNNFHLPYGIYHNEVNHVYKRKVKINSDSYTCQDALRACKTPVLFIHGTDDHFVPVEMTYENYKNCASPKRLFVVPGAGHGMSYVVDPEGYENAVKAFWDDNDNFTSHAEPA